MPAKVVDASVVAAWCFREPRAVEALRIISDTDIHAPLLMAYELTSIARRKTLAYPEQAAAIEEALKTAFALPIHWAEVDHVAVLHLAIAVNLTSYDASYLYLANRLHFRLATFDRILERATNQT